MPITGAAWKWTCTALHPPPAASLSQTRSDEGPGAETSNFMYILEVIFRTIVNLFKQAWLLPQIITMGLQQRRRQLAQNQFEAERLDRIRNPSKYAGRCVRF